MKRLNLERSQREKVLRDRKRGVDMRKVDGMVEDGFETLRDAFAEAQLQGEGGAQLCIYRHGKRVVDLWTGRDKVNDRPYTAATISVQVSLADLWLPGRRGHPPHQRQDRWSVLRRRGRRAFEPGPVDRLAGTRRASRGTGIQQRAT